MTDITKMVNVYEAERARYVGRTAYYPNNQAAFEGAMRKATEGFAIVPLEPTEAQLDTAVAFTLNVKVSKEYTWTKYAGDLYKAMIAAYKPTNEKE